MNRRTLTLALLVLALAACEPGRDDRFGAAPGGADPVPGSGDGPVAPDDRLGTVALTLQATEPMSADWEVVVRVFPLRAGADPYEERLDLEALRQLVYLYVVPDTYRVSAEVVDVSSGDVLMSGEAAGVEVLAQQTTSVTIALEPSAALQVVVDLDRGGRRFGCEYLDTTRWAGYNLTSMFGAQRLERDHLGELRPRYYLWLRLASRTMLTEEWRLYRSFSLDPFDFSAPLTATMGGGSWLSAAAVGGRFYLAGDGAGYRAGISVSDDGTTWQRLADTGPARDIPGLEARVADEGVWVTGYLLDGYSNCGLLADNQFNLFCGVQDHFLGTDGEGQPALWTSTGLFHAWAPDGVSWRGFFETVLPLDDPAYSHQPSIAVAVEFSREQTSYMFQIPPAPDVVGAQLRGGVYQVWYVPDMAYGSGGAPGPSEFRLIESTDRTNWSQPETVSFDPAQTAAGCADHGGTDRHFVTFVAPDGVHVYSLMQDAVGSFGTPFYQLLRHLWSVD